MPDLTVASSCGSITISRDVVADIVTETVARCYGVVGVTTRSRVGRLLRRGRITIGGDAGGMRIGLHVVVEYGLNLAEVAATVRSQVTYDVERLTGLTVEAVEVFVEDVKVSA